MTKPQRNENADVLSILSSLIEFRTYSQQPNHQITNWIEAYLKKYSIACWSFLDQRVIELIYSQQ